MQLTLTEEEAVDLKAALWSAISASSAFEADWGFLLGDEERQGMSEQRERWTQLEEKLP